MFFRRAGANTSAKRSRDGKGPIDQRNQLWNIGAGRLADRVGRLIHYRELPFLRAQSRLEDHSISGKEVGQRAGANRQ